MGQNVTLHVHTSPVLSLLTLFSQLSQTYFEGYALNSPAALPSSSNILYWNSLRNTMSQNNFVASVALLRRG
jgi:hypothetical protein